MNNFKKPNLGSLEANYKTLVTQIDHLIEEGYSSDELAAVSTPIGLSIGAETPEEIALSVLAEIIMLRRGARGERLSS